MPTSPPAIIDPDLLVTIRRHLEGLRRSPDGAALYALIERGLRRFAGPDGRIELAFVTFLNSILGRFARDEVHDSSTRFKARLIQQRLMLHLPAGAPPAARPRPPAAPPRRPEAADPQATARQSRAAPVPTAEPSAALQVASPAPRDAAADPAGDATARSASPPVSPEATGAASSSTPAEEASETARPASPAGPSVAPEPPGSQPSPAPGAVKAEPPAAEVAKLVDRVTESITFNTEFDEMLASQGRSMARVDDAIRDFKDLKQLIVRGLDDLIKERETLKHQLTSAAEHVRTAEVERAQLRRELSTARKHSQIDELTGLPKRDTFVRTLESEIARVRRYGFALTLALVDVDDLATVNREHGQEAGDAVLRCYAAEVLGNFRSYDLVARYDDDAFAVLFPNTQKEGALRALDKARKRATESFLTHNDRHFPLPGFSSVLAVYAPGEKAAALLRRADEALDHAKLKARGQTVFALPSA